MIVKQLTEHHLEFLSLKGGCIGSSESTRQNTTLLEITCTGSLIANIRIYHDCEGGKGKSVLRINDWHQEACQVMTNADREVPNLRSRLCCC